jgi:hypothetical protein
MEGGLTRKRRCMSASAGRALEYARIGVDEGQILGLLSINPCPRAVIADPGDARVRAVSGRPI